MINYGLIAGCFWVIWIIYWVASATNVKKDIPTKTNIPGWIILRIIFIAIITEFVDLVGVKNGLFAPGGQVSGLVGTIFVFLGLAFAIWARIHLGRNWSSRPMLKEGHELVTSGPYAFVRHPIYTGMLFALLGTSIIEEGIWFLVFIFGLVVFIQRIAREERLMMQQFPDQYPEYKKRTYALIPFIF